MADRKVYMLDQIGVLALKLVQAQMTGTYSLTSAKEVAQRALDTSLEFYVQAEQRGHGKVLNVPRMEEEEPTAASTDGEPTQETPAAGAPA